MQVSYPVLPGGRQTLFIYSESIQTWFQAIAVGRVTYHGPGMMASVFGANLKRRKLGVRELVTLAGKQW